MLLESLGNSYTANYTSKSRNQPQDLSTTHTRTHIPTHPHTHTKRSKGEATFSFHHDGNPGPFHFKLCLLQRKAAAGAVRALGREVSPSALAAKQKELFTASLSPEEKVQIDNACQGR